MTWYVIGSLAALFTSLGFVPQILKVLRTKSVADISLFTFLQFCVGISLWTSYGIHLRDPIIVVANSVTMVTLFISIALYLRYRRRAPRPT